MKTQKGNTVNSFQYLVEYQIKAHVTKIFLKKMQQLNKARPQCTLLAEFFQQRT